MVFWSIVPIVREAGIATGRVQQVQSTILETKVVTLPCCLSGILDNSQRFIWGFRHKVWMDNERREVLG